MNSISIISSIFLISTSIFALSFLVPRLNDLRSRWMACDNSDYRQHVHEHFLILMISLTSVSCYMVFSVLHVAKHLISAEPMDNEIAWLNFSVVLINIMTTMLCKHTEHEEAFFEKYYKKDFERMPEKNKNNTLAHS